MQMMMVVNLDLEMMDVSENTTSTTVTTGVPSNYASTAAAAKDFEDALNDVSKLKINCLLADG